MPKISVIIPTCNRPELLGRAIKSVLNQTFQDFEVIVVDDGEEKPAEQTVKSFHSDVRVKYVKNIGKKGAPVARNLGTKMAQGEYLAFLDDDDSWLSEKLNEQLLIIEKFKNEIDFVFCPVKVSYQASGKKVVQEVKEIGVNNYFELLLAHRLRILTSSLLIKKDAFYEVDGFDDNFPSNQEWDLMIRVSKKRRGYCLNKPLVEMNILAGEHIGANLDKRIKGREMILRKHLDDLRIRPKVLASHYFELGLFYRDAGKTIEAKKYFLQAWKLNKKKVIFLVHFLLIILALFKKSIVRIYVKFKFFGFKYKCPFCGGHFREFFSAGLSLPVFKERKISGGGHRLHVRCPFCNSSSRERLCYLFLEDQKNLYERGIKILHVAPEKNLRKFFEKKYKNYFSIDLRPGVAAQAMSITDLKYSDDFFDVIICSHVLEHVVDDKKAMVEIYRVLRQGGLAILQTPLSDLPDTYEDFSIINPKAREKAFGQNDHVRIYGREDYLKRLRRAGFNVEIFNFSKRFGESLAEKYSLGSEQDLYVCRK